MFIREIPVETRVEFIGTCENSRAFDVYSAAARLLTNRALIDQSIGEVAICVCGNFVTLPPDCETVLAMQVGGSPAIIRNDWFTYHINGTGDQGWTPCGFADVLGNQFPTIRDPDRPVKLVTRIYATSDQNRKIRVHGWDAEGKRLMSVGPDGRLADGFFVPTIFGSSAALANINPIAKIDSIWKEASTSLIELLAVDPDTNTAIATLGRYGPDETSPRYTRIRVPQEQVVRVRYRRRDIQVRTEDDWINVDDPEAFLLACKAVVKRRAGQYGEADACELSAVRMIKQAQDRRQHGGVAPPQVIVSADNLGPGKVGMFYVG